MAVVTVKSGPITNRDANPRVLNNGAVVKGDLCQAIGKCAIANGDSVGSKYLACQIPSSAVGIRVFLSCADIGTTTAADVGIYKSTQDGGAVVDADFFASAASLSGGALAESSVERESGVYSIANSEKPLWQALGLSADPNLIYDVVLTLTGAADAAGDVLTRVTYAC